MDRATRESALGPIDPAIAVSVVPDPAADFHVEREGIRLNVVHRTVAPDEVSQLRSGDHPHLGRGKIILIPKPIAVAQPRELIDENTLESGPDSAAANVCFGKPGRPEIHVVHTSI